MQNCELPTRDECVALLAEYYVPSHIIRHSEASAKVAVFLARRLREAGHDVNVELVDRACVLHDLLRACDFKLKDFSRFEEPVSEEAKSLWRRFKEKYDGQGHEYAAYDVLKERWPELALTIRRHKYIALLDEDDKPRTWEEKIVYYADKRAMHDQIVPLQQRLDEAHARSNLLFGVSKERQEKIAIIDKLIFEMEAEIFGQIGLEPDLVSEEFIDSFDG